MTDAVRFSKFDDLVDICKVEESLKDLLVEVLGDVLSGMVTKVSKRAQAMRMGEALRQCSEKLAQCSSLRASCQLDVNRLHQALTTPSDFSDVTLGMDLNTYYGILKPLFDNENWKPLFEEWSQLQEKQKPCEVRQLWQCWAACPADLQKAKDLEAALLAGAKLESSRADAVLVLQGLKLSTEQKAAELQKVTVELSKSIREGSVVNFVDLLEKYESTVSWPVDELRKHEALKEVCVELGKVQSKQQSLVELGQLLVKFAQEFTSGCQPSPNKCVTTPSGVETWTALKSMLQTQEWPQTVMQELSELLDRTRSDEQATALFASTQEKWQEKVRSVLKLALEGAPSEEFNASLRTIEAEEHAAMQACALSSTPVFDRSVVAFTAKAVVEVCKALQMVKSGCQPVVNRALQDHLDACLSEDGKLKLAKVVTQKEQLDDFLKITKEQGAEWQEQLRAKQKEASEKAAESKEKLEGFLVPLGESHWEEWLKKVPAQEKC